MTQPSGIIVIWSGAIVDIPPGWFLCDGNNGTPDLTDRFLLGAGDSFAVDETGGSATHQHNFTGDGHDHTLQGGAAISGGAVNSATTTEDPAVGTTVLASSMPKYYALAYIMKS